MANKAANNEFKLRDQPLAILRGGLLDGAVYYESDLNIRLTAHQSTGHGIFVHRPTNQFEPHPVDKRFQCRIWRVIEN